MATGQPVTDSEELPDYTAKAFNLSPWVGADTPKLFHSFGDVIHDVVPPEFNDQDTYTITATFVAGNPRNNVMLEDTFLTVERRDDCGNWVVIRTDHDYDTR